jgi:hypothetical protein
MISSAHSLQAAQAQTQTAEAVQAPKTLQKEAAKKYPESKDTVTISREARQLQTHSTTQAGGGGANDRGNNH